MTNAEKNLKHVGKQVNRLKREPREKVFAEAWERENTRGNCESTLTHLLHSDGTTNRPSGLTQEECTIAATVIQWLGSPIGFRFLEDALAKAGYQVVEEEYAQN